MERNEVVPALDKFSSPKLDAIVGEMGGLGLDRNLTGHLTFVKVAFFV